MESNLIFSDEPIFIKNGISDWSLIDGNIFEILLSSFPNSKIVKDINIDKSTENGRGKMDYKQISDGGRFSRDLCRQFVWVLADTALGSTR